ncbi:MAG TPA: methyltransferase domain-containing protein [Pseudomonadales bacterium]
MTDADTFYTDHWKHIEDERLARYEQMFVWRAEQLRLLEPAGIASGQRVVDLGCGPGFLSLAVAEIVGATGAVHGMDINERFVADGTRRARERGLGHATFHHVAGAALPLDTASMDVVVAKNVLEYVPDLNATLAEAVRVLAPGGRLHAIDSDWGFVIVEPWGKATVDRFFAAAAPAFREPYIGRKLPAAFHAAGLSDIEVRIVPIVDRSGAMLSVLRNMRSYIRTFATLPDAEVDELLAAAERGVGNATYMACLPQFLVTGTRAIK